jgi:signal transduction histidine kinase
MVTGRRVRVKEKRTYAGGAARPVQRLARVASEALEETRRMAHGLRPMVLDDLGLPAALARLAEDVGRVHGVQVTRIVPPNRPHSDRG